MGDPLPKRRIIQQGTGTEPNKGPHTCINKVANLYRYDNARVVPPVKTEGHYLYRQQLHDGFHSCVKQSGQSRAGTGSLEVPEPAKIKQVNPVKLEAPEACKKIGPKLEAPEACKKIGPKLEAPEACQKIGPKVREPRPCKTTGRRSRPKTASPEEHLAPQSLLLP